MKGALRLLVLVLCAGCGQSQGSADSAPVIPPRPTIDLSTPDRALKSYWEQREWWYEASLVARTKVQRTPGIPETAAELLDPITTSEARRFFSDIKSTRTKLRRDIETVRVETATRAVAEVRIRNVTPIPEGVKGTYREMKEREAGQPFRYILERDGRDWRVAEIWQHDEHLGGWRSMTEERAPSYPSNVYYD